MSALPSTFDVLKTLAVALGLNLDLGYAESHHDAIRRAAKGVGEPGPGSTALDDAVSAACGALVRLGGGPDEPAGELIGWHIHNAGILYERLCLYLDVGGTPPIWLREVLLDRFAVPFIGVTIGEHVEAYYAGVSDFPALPGVLLRTPPDRVPRPLDWVLRGLARRCEVDSAPALVDELDIERARLYEWVAWPANRTHTISPAKVDALVRHLEERELLTNPDPLLLDRFLPFEDQARIAAVYALERYDPEQAAEVLRTDIDSLSDAARGDARQEFAFHLVASADAEWRPWTLQDVRNELIVGRAIEDIGNTLDAVFDSPDWPPGSPVRTWFDEVWHLAASIRRRGRLRIRTETGDSNPDHEERDLLSRMPFEVQDVRPRDEDELEALSRVQDLYMPVEVGFLRAMVGELGEGVHLDPRSWSEALREAWGLVEPLRSKRPGDPQRVMCLLNVGSDEDSSGWWALVRARHEVQQHRLVEAAAWYEAALKLAARRTPLVGRIATVEGLSVAARLGRRRFNNFHKLTVRAESTALAGRDMDKESVERLSVRLDHLFPELYSNTSSGRAQNAR